MTNNVFKHVELMSFYHQAKLSEQHEQAKQVAAFNLQMSKKEKSSCSDCDESGSEHETRNLYPSLSFVQCDDI